MITMVVCACLTCYANELYAQIGFVKVWERERGNFNYGINNLVISLNFFLTPHHIKLFNLG